MEDHYSGHEQSRQVSEVGGGLEDDGVGELDAAGGAGGEEEGVVQGGEGCGGAEEEAEREGRRRCREGVKSPKAMMEVGSKRMDSREG